MKFLVCIDGSPRSYGVIPHAARLASVTGAEITLTRVLDPRVDAASVVAPELEPALKQVEAAWTADLESHLGGLGVPAGTTILRRQWGKDIADAIAGAAMGEGYALIALTSRGSGAVRHALLGSVSMGVISRGADPVLVIGAEVAPPATDRDGYHLLITSDGSPDARSVFEGLRPLLATGGVRVTLLQVVTVGPGETEAAAKLRASNDLAALQERLPDGVRAELEVRTVPPGAGIDTAILAAASAHSADAVAMATHGHSARRHLVAGSTAMGVLGQSTLPVILVKSRAVD